MEVTDVWKQTTYKVNNNNNLVASVSFKNNKLSNIQILYDGFNTTFGSKKDFDSFVDSIIKISTSNIFNIN
jgi:hypothetical protein